MFPETLFNRAQQLCPGPNTASCAAKQAMPSRVVPGRQDMIRIAEIQQYMATMQQVLACKS